VYKIRAIKDKIRDEFEVDTTDEVVEYVEGLANKEQWTVDVLCKGECVGIKAVGESELEWAVDLKLHHD
jgi:hypothetical protein